MTPDTDEEQPESFEEALEQLDEIVAALEGGELPLDDAIDRFERGLSLLKASREKLEKAELRVQELLESGETEPFEES